MPKKHKKIIAIFIAYKAAKTLAEFYKNFPKTLVDDIILVDDHSKDGTYQLAKKLKIKSFENPVNLGYGGNLKKAISYALKNGAEIIIDIHPDGEYKPTAIKDAVRKINEEDAQMVLGNRFASFNKVLKNGMYFWKIIPLRFLNYIDNLILGTNIGDFHQGFRVYTKDMLEKISFENNTNDYLFSFELIVQSVFSNIKIAQVPVETSYTGKKRGATLKHSIKYTLGTFRILKQYILAKLGFNIFIFQSPTTSLQQRIKKIINT